MYKTDLIRQHIISASLPRLRLLFILSLNIRPLAFYAEYTAPQSTLALALIALT